MRVQFTLMVIACCAAAFTPACGASMSIDTEARILRLEDRRESVHRLRPFLADPAPEVRARAALAAGRIAGPTTGEDDAQAATARAMLSDLLRRDPSAEVRAMAAFALGLVQSEAAGAGVAALLAAGSEESAEVRAAAVEALGRCGPDPHPAAMASALEDADAGVRQAALLAVWKGTRPLHVDAVLKLSTDRDVETRWRAAYALMRMAGARASGRTPIPGGAALSQQQLAAILGRLLELCGDADLRVRLQALRGLRALASPDPSDTPDPEEPLASLAQPARDALAAALSDPDPRARVEAVRSLGGLLVGRPEQETSRLAFCDPHPHVQVELLRALGAVHEPPRLFELIGDRFDAPLAWERAVAYEVAIGACRDGDLIQQALHLVARALEDRDWSVRFAAAAELAAIGEAVAADSMASGEDAPTPADREAPERRLLRQLTRRCLDDDPRVAKAVVIVWMSLRAADGIDLESLLLEMASFSESGDEVLRLLVVEGVRQVLGQPGASPLSERQMAILAGHLEPLARDPSADVRGSLVGLWADLLESDHRIEAARRLYAIALHDEDRRVRTAARSALQEAASSDDAWAPAARGLRPRPQDTGRTAQDYARLLRNARASREAILETAAGTLRIALYGADAPLTVANFARLSGNGFYDDGRWHRVVPDFVVQDGCPRGDGWGGPGYAIRCEYNPLHYEPGTLGMAHAGKDTGGSQFFLALSDQPHLDGRYTIFGRLIDGWDALGAIVQGDPIERVRIVRDGGQPR